jgi:membrane protease YdiL (CAAX protease family)
MNWEMQPQSPPAQPVSYSVPWKSIDNWIGVLLLVLINVGLLVLSRLGQRGDIAQSWILILVQLVYLLPVAIILVWRRINWSAIGFGKFDWASLGIGCGLLVIGYGIIFIHNLILMALGVNTQGEMISELIGLLENPFWFFLVGAVMAPLVEEIFFRGFLFQGFRARYGWIISMLLSSSIFAVAHLDPASLIPTFILGNLLAYLYHRTNSIWPGVILHVLINTFGLALVYFFLQNPDLIPS